MKCSDNLLLQNPRSVDNVADVGAKENKTSKPPRDIACLHQGKLESGVYDQSTNLGPWNCVMSTACLPQEIGELRLAEYAHSGLTRTRLN
jgi:hypothetical protein